MDTNWLTRTELLLTAEKTEQLKKSNVLIVGLGGVGAYAVEMLARAGVGKMTIVDGDTVNLTNLNRQLLATHSNLNRPKADVMAERLRDINPDIELEVINEFIEEDRTIEILKSQAFDYVIDAIDTLTPKVHLIYNSTVEGIRIISSMGAGGKRNPESIFIKDMSETYNCRLAKIVRKRLSRLGLKKGVKTVFSTEQRDINAVQYSEDERNKKSTVGTISYMPAIFGCTLAAAVINDLIAD